MKASFGHPTHVDLQSTNATFAAKYHATFVADTVGRVKYGVKLLYTEQWAAIRKATDVAYCYFVCVDRKRGHEIVVPPQ
jgi:ribosomal protein S5